MVNKDRVRLGGNGRFNQGTAGRHPGDDFAYLGCPFDLQSVGAVIMKALRLEQLVKVLQKLSAVSHINCQV